MAREEQIIIEVEVNAGQSAERLALVQEKIQRLKAANKELRTEQKAINEELRVNGTISEKQAKRLADIAEEVATNTASLKELTSVEKMYTAQVQIATQNDRKFGDSITELGAQLAQLKSEYRGLTKAQRESAEGQDMLKNIQRLDQEVKNLDYSLGDHQRNVGNYVSALTGLNGNVLRVANLFQGGFRQGVAAATTALKSFAKTLLTTPLGWIAAAVTAVVGVFRQLREAFQRNDDAGTKLSAALQRLSPVVTAIKNVFNALAGVVATIVDGFTRAAAAVMTFFVPSLKEASKAASEAETRLDALQEAERQYTVATAERARERAKLEERARYEEGLTAEERVKLLEKSRDLAIKDLEEDRRIKKEKLDLLLEEQRRTADYSDAMADRIAQARAAYINSETEMIQGTRRLNSQLKSQREEMQREAEAARKAEQERARAAREAAQRAAEERAKRLKTQEDEIRALQDLTIELITDEAQRERAKMQAEYSRRIEDLKKRLETEKDLTAQAREAINGQVLLLERQLADGLAALDEQRIKERAEAERKLAQETIDARIRAIEDTAERETAQEKETLKRRVSALRERLQTEAGLTAEMRAQIEEQIALAEAESAKKVEEITAAARKEAIQKTFSDMQKEMDNQFAAALLKAGDNAAEAARVQLEAARAAYDELLRMDAETKAALYTSEADYTAAVIAAEAQVTEARKASGEAVKSQAQELASTMQSVTGALSDLFESAAGDSEEYEKFKKAMAIVDAMISMATTIAAATAVSTEGDPYTMAIRIATNVAAVTAQFAAVIKAIRAATVPSKPTFATGGIVPGTSWSGDRVDARLNSGEMVINRKDQQRLWELVSGGVPFAGIDYRLLAAAVAEGVEALPAPILDYSEFTRFRRRVEQVEKIAKLTM